ncbi:MAG: undecaprenyl-phosphate glucose phosphotransferase, partial [Thermomicrobium sp.]|nr:undecaprenyl-phosphate glucose phosphotransferase [Thermomicrobium sp.]
RRRSWRRNWLPRVAQAAFDGTLLAAAFWLAYHLRYRWEFGGDVPSFFVQPFEAFLGRSALFVSLTLLVFTLRGLYRLPRWTSFLDEASIIASGVT